MDVTELSGNEMRSIEGGDSYVTFTDSQGYNWVYTYSDRGNLVSACVQTRMTIM